MSNPNQQEGSQQDGSILNQDGSILNQDDNMSNYSQDDNMSNYSQDDNKQSKFKKFTSSFKPGENTKKSAQVTLQSLFDTFSEAGQALVKTMEELTGMVAVFDKEKLNDQISKETLLQQKGQNRLKKLNKLNSFKQEIEDNKNVTANNKSSHLYLNNDKGVYGIASDLGSAVHNGVGALISVVNLIPRTKETELVTKNMHNIIKDLKENRLPKFTSFFVVTDKVSKERFGAFGGANITERMEVVKLCVKNMFENLANIPGKIAKLAVGVTKETLKGMFDLVVNVIDLIAKALVTCLQYLADRGMATAKVTKDYVNSKSSSSEQQVN